MEGVQRKDERVVACEGEPQSIGGGRPAVCVMLHQSNLGKVRLERFRSQSDAKSSYHKQPRTATRHWRFRHRKRHGQGLSASACATGLDKTRSRVHAIL